MQNSNKITAKPSVGVQISLLHGTNKKIVALRSKTGFHTHKGSSTTEKKKEKAGQNNKRVVLQDIRLMMIEFPDFHHA